MRLNLPVFMLFAGALLAPAAMGKKPDDTAETVDAEEIEVVTLKDGSIVEFVELEPGVITVFANLGEEGEKEFKEKKEKKVKDKDGRWLKDKAKDTPPGFYKRLTGKSSKKLDEAWQRALVVAENAHPENEEIPDEVRVIEDDGEDRRRLLRSSDGRQLEDWSWVNNQCTQDYLPEFCRCRTHRTTSTQDEIYNYVAETEDIDVYFKPYIGSARQKVYWGSCTSGCSTCCFIWCWSCNCWTSCVWKIFQSKYTYQGQTSYIGSYNARKYKWKFVVDQASGDSWHYSVFAGDSAVGVNDYTCPYVA